MVNMDKNIYKTFIKGNKFHSLVNQIRVGFQQNQKWIYVENSTYTKKLLRILKQAGLVISYLEIKNHCKIVLCYSHLQTPPFSIFNLLSKSTQKNFWTVHQLKANVFSLFPGRTYILLTRLGLLTSYEAIKLNIGGEVLCEIY